MLAKIAEQPFDNDEWVFETKYDGYRALALCDGKEDIQLYSRNLLSFNKKYPQIVEQLQNIKHHCLLDGEVVIEDKNGRSQFQLLQNYMNTGKGNLKYYVFDLLELNDQDITGLELVKRKELLKLLIAKAKLKNIVYSEHIDSTGKKFYKEALKKGWEGIMAKRKDGLYLVNRRSGDWKKIKIVKQQEVIIAGFTAPQGSRKHFGSLILGAYKNKQCKYVGHCGTGFDTKTLQTLYNKFKPLFTRSSPFTDHVIPNNKVQWLKPQLVCEVKFTEWTEEESMRHPVFLGLREDKKPKEVIIEKA